MSQHPIQPLEKDADGTLRFKGNAIVQHLLDHGMITLNDLAVLEFSQEDREQFAQLIGYSLGGFGELSYVTDETYSAAKRIYEAGGSPVDARLFVATAKLAMLRDALRGPVAELYGIHPDDLDVEVT